MNILISAYACEPHKGSEPGVGWRWAIELARLGHHVWVITRANNRESIEVALASHGGTSLHFIYYDLPTWAMWWKKYPGGVYLYYLLWQFGTYWVAREWTKKVHFDLSQHITLGTFRFPSSLAFLGLPFVFGPVGGGETTPPKLRKSYPVRGRVMDFIRAVSNRTILLNPLIWTTFNRATLILCRTRETIRCIPTRYWKKCRLQSDIGVDLPMSVCATGLAGSVEAKRYNYRLLYVGRLLYWKGVHLGLQAFAELQKEIPLARLTIVGSGPEELWLRHLADKLGVDEAIDWVPWLPRDEVMNYYMEHDIFLFPSLHDSGGTVVLEALSYGLPVICFDLGGPGAIVDDTCGRAISTKARSEKEVVAEMSKHLETLAKDYDIYKACQAGAVARASSYNWSTVVAQGYSYVESASMPFGRNG